MVDMVMKCIKSSMLPNMKLPPNFNVTMSSVQLFECIFFHSSDLILFKIIQCEYKEQYNLIQWKLAVHYTVYNLYCTFIIV